ncbi:MAG: type II toxin-antitoxin system RelE/ParE family toxin [Limisphaerales bacterium]
MKPHIFHPDADEEYVHAVQYYADIDIKLGNRFYDKIERVIGEVCANPERFRKFDPPAQRHFSRDFPFAVIFLNKPEYVWIVAVMHMKRRPGYWRGRLE